MDQVRKPFQGVWNIVRFNWHFYVAAACAMLGFWALAGASEAPLAYGAQALALLIGGTTLVSLLVSWYVYDVSGLYSLEWLGNQPFSGSKRVVNIHAGFDESSALLSRHFPGAELAVFDFYNPAHHTEVSIRRARAAYPAFLGTQSVQTHHLPLPDNSADWVFISLAAHEVRQPAERVAFFQEVRRIVQPYGRVVVVEHLRDAANFMAYTIGFFHFYSRRSWLKVFNAAELHLTQEKKITPFVSAFILRRGSAA
ncbi:class I SAM-dependent methyltransferase [Hymenobacter tenuis]